MRTLLAALMLSAATAGAWAQPDESLDDILDAQSAPGFSREEAAIASFVQGANRGALAVAGVAAKNGSTADVRALARHILMERQDLGGAFDAIAEMRGLPAQPPPDGEEFQFQGEEAARSLASMEGQAHDRFFLDWVEDHSRRLMDRIDANSAYAGDARISEYLTKLHAAAERDFDIAAELKKR